MVKKEKDNMLPVMTNSYLSTNVTMVTRSYTVIVEFSRVLTFRFVTICLRLASPFYVYYINVSLPSWVLCCFASSSCSKAGMSNSLTSFVIIQ